MIKLEQAADLIPRELMEHSGKVFYSGRESFESQAMLYVLGLNPGGKGQPTAKDSVGGHTEWTLSQAPSNWSAYRDESWGGKPPGTRKMQPRILHMMRRVGLDPGQVPASNVVFLRSARGDDLGSSFDRLADLCWPFHDHVLKMLRPKAILCLGQKAGKYVRLRVGANEHLATFVEANARNWESHLFGAADGTKVIVATHPSIADWTKPATDPSGLVLEALRSGARSE